MLEKQINYIASVILTIGLLSSCQLTPTVFSVDNPILEYVTPCIWQNIGY